MRVWLSIAALAFSLDTFGHHSASIFDPTTITTVEGRVTRVSWKSPHVYVFIETTEGTETAEWRFESVGVPILVRQGWTEDSLTPGEVVIAEVYALRNSDQRYAWLQRVIKEDGTVLDTGRFGPARLADDGSER